MSDPRDNKGKSASICIPHIIKRLGLRCQSAPAPPSAPESITQHVPPSTSYIYEPLQLFEREIRLVRLAPRRESLEFMTLDLINTSLDANIEFTALSYVWGDPRNTSIVMLDGYPFAVTNNLFAALHELRDEQQPVILWIDAICIQQSDNREKAWQVLLMGQIYVKATKTIVWLGSDGDMAGQVMEAFLESADLASLVDTEDFLQHLQQDLAELALQDANFGLGQIALKKLLNRGYWFRTWCLQEFCLSGNLFIACGKYQIKAEIFQNMAKVFLQAYSKSWTYALSLQDMITANTMNPAAFMPENIAGMEHGATRMFQQRERFRNRFYNPSLRQSLSDLLIYAFTNNTVDMSLQATDPRDRIFGLINLAGDFEELQICPNYDKTCEDVFTETWSAILAHGQADLLKYSQYGWKQTETTESTTAHTIKGAIDSFALDSSRTPRTRRVPEDDEELPSWVPDWRITRDPSPRTSFTDRGFAACGDKITTNWIPTNDIRIIALTGVKVDTIEEVGTIMNPTRVADSEFSHASTFLKEIQSFVKKSCMTHPDAPIYDPATATEAVWRIPVGDREIISEVGSEVRRATAVSAERLASLQNVIIAKEEAMTSDDRLSAIWAFANTVQENVGKFNHYCGLMMTYNGWKPFLSSRGFVGLGPTATRAGDILAIFYGSKLPFVLRPQGPGRYQLLGEAYVHGLMDGEFMQTQREEVNFYIC